MSGEQHHYDGWANGQAFCTCGSVFDSVQQFERHAGLTIPTPVPSEVTETTAGEREVEALAKALTTRHPDGYTSPLQSDYVRRLVAEQLLTSDWLAAHDDRVRREEGAKVLREAEDALNREGLSFKEGGWGSNPADQQILDVIVKTLTWLRARAASVGRGEDEQ